MEKAELHSRLVVLQTHDDNEDAHQQADDLLLEFINDEEITEAFKAVPRWYA